MPTDLRAALQGPLAASITKPAKEDDIDKNVDDEDDEASDGDEGEEDKKNKKSKKVKKAEEKEDEDDDKKPDARAARGREKARIDTIMSCAAAKQFPGAALNLALNSSISRHQAVQMLASMTSDLSSGNNRRAALAERMARISSPNVGPDGGDAPIPGSTSEIAAAIVRAGQKRRGEI